MFPQQPLFQHFVRAWLASGQDTMTVLSDPGYHAVYFGRDRQSGGMGEEFCECLGAHLGRTPFQWAHASVLDGGVLGLPGVEFSVAPHVFDRFRWTFALRLPSGHARLALEAIGKTGDA